MSQMQMYSLHTIPAGPTCPPKVIKLHLVSGKSWILDPAFNIWTEIPGGQPAPNGK